MNTTNARISFSTSSEKTWEDVNPKLMEGEPVFAKTGDGKYKLVVGNIGGSNYKESVLVWDQKSAEKMVQDSETAVRKAQSSAGSAKSSAESATNSATAAKSSEQIVSGYATSAETAKTKSEEILKSVQQSEKNAKTSENNAKASEEKSVTVSAEAVQAATNAKQSESNALTSASNAKDSETNAKTHEDATAGHAKAAAESLGQVTQAKKDAETAAASALSSKNAAEQSASLASTSESKAKASELAASGFSESAQASAGSAKEYYEKAEASATAAASSELSAKNQAQSVAQSATSSEASASAAADSASAALQSQNAAKTSADESLKTETSCKSIYEQIKNAPEILNAEKYYQKEESDRKYQLKGDYVTESIWNAVFNKYINQAIHKSAMLISFLDVYGITFNKPLIDYFNKQESDRRYQAKGDYATNKKVNDLLNLLQRNKSYQVGDIVNSAKLPSYMYLECVQAGTTGSVEPELSTGGVVVNDGSCKFRVMDKRMKAMIDILYPIGIVITTATDNTPKPGEAYGLAQWEEIGRDRVLQGCSTGAGSTIEAGLPNITGEFYLRPLSDGNGISWNDRHGAIESKIVAKPDDASGSIANGSEFKPMSGLFFDASKSNNIYGKSNTVQPSALKVHFWKRIK